MDIVVFVDVGRVCGGGGGSSGHLAQIELLGVVGEQRLVRRRGGTHFVHGIAVYLVVVVVVVEHVE